MIGRIRNALQTKTSTSVEITNYRKDGSVFHNRFMLLPLTGQGQARYFLGIQDCPQEVLDEYKAGLLEIKTSGNGTSGASGQPVVETRL